MIKFISYTGKYPNLCSGILTLEIDGDIIRFGYDKECDYSEFWTSGGTCGFDSDWENYINHNEWIIDEELLPLKYRKYAKEIKDIFNINVPYGCCGGCL